MLTNTQVRYFDSNVLRLQRETRTEYHAQVDRLISALTSSLKENTKIRVTRVVKAGSFAKFTILRKTSTDPVDVDLVFYICGKSVDESSYESLSSEIYDLLIELYPNKAVEDFEIQRRAATVEFKGTGLLVDIVPVIEIPEEPGQGYQFDRDGTKTKTCAPCQIDFVKSRKNQDSDFRTLVRLAKKWRNYINLHRLKSFHIELILAFIQDRDGPCERIEQRFCDFLLYIAQSELKEVIRFPENKGSLRKFEEPVVIVDPVNNENNTASRLSDAERKEIVEAARGAWEAAIFASTEDDPQIWKELFGPKFRTED